MPLPSLRRLSPWLPEVALLLLGFVLRATMLTRYPYWRGYDFISHWKYVEWMRREWAIPHPFYSRSTYQPPLYYLAVAALSRLGVADANLPSFTIVAGCLRLVLLEAGLLLVFPSRRLVRVAALAVAVVLPASVHLDGMINCEGLLGLLAAAFVLAAWLGLSRQGRARWAWWLAAGVLASLTIMTKISVTTTIAAVVVAAGVDVARMEGDWRARARRVLPVVSMLGVLLASTGWYFARNQRLYGKALLTGYDFRERDAYARIEHVPLWKRRNLGYVLGWTMDVYRHPTWPSGYEPVPRFFPVLVATTFADYYRYAFAPEAQWRPDISSLPDRTAWELARVSIAAGTVVAGVTVAAWLAALLSVWRRRRAGELMLLCVPLFGVVGQLAFAWRYAVDWEGPVKGVYLQFAALPLCGVFGVGVEWLWRRGGAWRVLACVVGACVVAVGVYTGYARFASPVVH